MLTVYNYSIEIDLIDKKGLKAVVYFQADNSLDMVPVKIFYNEKWGYNAQHLGNEKGWINLPVSESLKDDFYVKKSNVRERESIALYAYLLKTNNLSQYLKEIKEERKENQNYIHRHCSNCRFQEIKEPKPENIEIVDKRYFCRKTGDTIDDKWLEIQKENQVTDKGLVHKKSKSTYDKEHPVNNPINPGVGRAERKSAKEFLENQNCEEHSYKAYKKGGEWKEGKILPSFEVNEDKEVQLYLKTTDKPALLVVDFSSIVAEQKPKTEKTFKINEKTRKKLKKFFKKADNKEKLNNLIDLFLSHNNLNVSRQEVLNAVYGTNNKKEVL